MLRRLLTLLRHLWAWLLGRDVAPASDRPVQDVPPPPSYPGPSSAEPAPAVPAPLPPPPAPFPGTERGEPELGATASDLPVYRKRDRLFTFQERKFYKVLQNEVANEFLIFPKVRMGDVVFLANEPANRKYHSNQVWGKHFDFLLCDKDLCQPLLAIELDDSSHRRYDSRQSDALKDWVCAQTGLPLLRVEVRASYPRGELRAKIQGCLQAVEEARERVRQDEQKEPF